MNNKTNPAFPVDDVRMPPETNGLSKREYAAIHILAALVSKHSDLNTETNDKSLAHRAVQLSEKLLNQFE